MRIFLLTILSFSFVACTSVESDRTTNFSQQVFNTRVDATTLNRKELNEALLIQNYFYKKKSDPLTKELEQLQLQRKPLFDQLMARYPECKRQKYCASGLTQISVKRIEEYHRESKRLKYIDFQIVDKETQLADLKEQHEIGVRRLYNRFLAGELSKVKEFQPRIKNVYLHALQLFNNRGSISRKLLTYTDQEIVMPQVSDLNFRMLGKPVDEAAILLTLDVYLEETLLKPTDPSRYLVTLLVNTHQIDAMEYETGYLKEWAKQLASPGLEQLKQNVFCGLYTIASPSMASKMQLSKLAYCRWQRDEMQQLNADQFTHRFPPERWIMPIAFVPMEVHR